MTKKQLARAKRKEQEQADRDWEKNNIKICRFLDKLWGARQ